MNTFNPRNKDNVYLHQRGRRRNSSQSRPNPLINQYQSNQNFQNFGETDSMKMYQSSYTNTNQTGSNVKPPYGSLVDSIEKHNPMRSMNSTGYQLQSINTGNTGKPSNLEMTPNTNLGPMRGPSFGRGNQSQKKNHRKRGRSPLQATFDGFSTTQGTVSTNFPLTSEKSPGSRNGKRGPKVPILPIPKSNGPVSSPNMAKYEFLDDLRVKNHPDFYEKHNGNTNKDSPSDGIGLPQPNNYLVKKKSNPKFGSTKSIKSQSRSKNVGKKKQKKSKKRPKSKSNSQKQIFNSRNNSKARNTPTPTGYFMNQFQPNPNNIYNQATRQHQSLRNLPQANQFTPSPPPQQGFNTNINNYSSNQPNSQQYSSQQQLRASSSSQGRRTNQYSSLARNQISMSAQKPLFQPQINHYSHSNTVNNADLNLFAQRSHGNQQPQPRRANFRNNNRQGQASLSNSQTRQNQNFNRQSVNGNRQAPIYSVEPSQNRNSSAARIPTDSNLDVSLTTVDQLEKEYGEKDIEKAYSRKTPTRRVNIENYKNILKPSYRNSIKNLAQVSPSIQKRNSLTQSNHSPMSVVVNPGTQYQSVPNQADKGISGVPIHQIQANLVQSHKKLSKSPMRAYTTVVPPTTTVVRIHGVNKSRGSSPLVINRNSQTLKSPLPKQRVYIHKNNERATPMSQKVSNQTQKQSDSAASKKDKSSGLNTSNTPTVPTISSSLKESNPMTTKSQPANKSKVHQSAPPLMIDSSQSNSQSQNNFTNTQSNSRLDTINEDRSNEDQASIINKTQNGSTNFDSSGNRSLSGARKNEFDSTKELQKHLKDSHTQQDFTAPHPASYPHQTPKQNSNYNYESNSRNNGASTSKFKSVERKNGNGQQFTSQMQISGVQSPSCYTPNTQKTQQTRTTVQTPQQVQDIEMEPYSFHQNDSSSSNTDIGALKPERMGVQINEQSINELSNLVEMLQTKLKTQERKNQELQSIVEQQKNDMEQLPLLQQTISMQEEAVLKLAEEKKELQASNQTLMSQIEEIQQIHSEEKNRIKLLDQQILKLKSEKQNLKKNFEQFQNENLRIQQDLQAQNAEICKVNQNLQREAIESASRARSNPTSNNDTEFINENIINLKSELTYANEEIKKLNKKRHKEKKKKDKIKKESIIEIAKRDEIIDACKAEIRSLKHQVRVLTSEIEGFNISECKSESQMQTTELGNSRVQRDSVSILKEQILVSQSVVQDLEEQNKILKKQLESKEYSKAGSSTQNEVQVFEHLKQKVDVLVEENQRLNSMLMQVHSQNNPHDPQGNSSNINQQVQGQNYTTHHQPQQQQGQQKVNFLPEKYSLVTHSNQHLQYQNFQKQPQPQYQQQQHRNGYQRENFEYGQNTDGGYRNMG